MAARLARELREAPSHPLAPERIVVPHPTLGRWLTLELASHLGVAAHLKVELPAQFAWSIMRDAVPTLPIEQPFAPNRLRWRIFETLADFTAGADAVRRYLEDGDPRKRFELAERLAGVYDRCLLYRPDWIREWEGGNAPHWQARLWQRLTVGETAPRHWVAAIDAYTAAASADVPETSPRRVSFFGIATLSPSYLAMLRTAAKHMDVHLHLLSPCWEYWADIAPRRVHQRQAAPEEPAAQHREEGNELLAAWSKLARDTQSLLVEQELAEGGPEEIHDEPPGETALGKVQRDVLDLKLASEAAAEDASSAGTDSSIQIHVCHSPTREAEALHDRLLALFDEHPDIEPADVLVLTPHIDEYAPAIESVFAAEGAIPCNVSRPREVATRGTQAFLDLLALPGSRYGAEAVLAPLESAAVQARLGIDVARLGDIRDWVRAAGIRWGVDAAHRRDEGLPAIRTHTWRFGLRRLLLDYAMTGDAVLFEDVAPCAIGFAGGQGSAEDYEALGRFVRYCEDAFKLRGWMNEALPAQEWVRKLKEEAVVPFFVNPDSASSEAARETASVQRLIDDLVDEWALDTPTPAEEGAVDVSAGTAAASSLQGELFGTAMADGKSPLENHATQPTIAAETLIPFTVLRDALRDVVASASRPVARLADGITVAGLATGQTFPAKVICVMGMNDRGFPRSPTPLSFDVMAEGDARRGDRNVRDEDRLAFLEALLAARRAFLVSYTGRGLRDDAAIPPSVLVDELREYLAVRFPAADFEYRHPVQPFSPRYFTAADGDANGDDAKLFSYSQGMLAAAQSVAGGFSDDAVAGRFGVPLPTPAAKSGPVPLDALIAFATAPARAFLQNRLGLRLETDDATLDEDEPFELHTLPRWQVRDRVFSLSRQGIEPARLAALVTASGALPQGTQGAITQEETQGAVDKLRTALAGHEGALQAPPLDLHLELDGFVLTGVLNGVDPASNNLICHRIGSVRAKHCIEAWVKLLAWAATSDGETPPWAGFIGLGGKEVEQAWFQAPSPVTARRALTAWLETWHRGQSELQPLAPEVSLAHAKAFSKSQGDADAAREVGLGAALRAWEGNPFPDAYERLAYGAQGPFAPRFAELAEMLLTPLVQAERKQRA